MKALHVLILLQQFFLIYAYNYTDITQHGLEQYQDIFINGKVVKPATNNHRDNEARYAIIKKVLSQYMRPFDMIDFGASQGYYSFRAAYDYDCVCVMIEGDNPSYPMIGRQLRELCSANSKLNNIILLQKPLNIPDIKRLSECEQVDVVLALNVIHWLGPNWHKAVDALVNLGSKIIIETPPQEPVAGKKENLKRKSIENYIINKGGIIIGQVKRHTSNTQANIYLIENDAPTIERTSWIREKHDINDYEIKSTYDRKTLIKHSKEKQSSTSKESHWYPGINLLTFKMYNGTFPHIETIIASVKTTEKYGHNDWMPNNMIVQGSTIQLIDNVPLHGKKGDVPKRKYSPKFANSLYHMLRMPIPKDVETYFWNKLCVM